MQDFPEHLAAALADRYRLERKIGEGGMAAVYLAEDLRHGRKVAVKVLRPELAAVLGADRFVQEIRTTAQLQHPHILPLYDSGSVSAVQGDRTAFLYYVMPWIEGETLRNKLDREQQLSIPDAVSIATEVADALHYAHSHGVIHRDIKPENILLRDGRAIVADFGIALAVSAAAGGRMTESGVSLGTPHYMSPEQATADKQLTNRSDIYSLGSVLYESLTGEPPHTGATAQMIVMKIVTDSARPVRELRKSVPPHVAAAVSTALEKIPADRFDSARAFSEALHNPAYVTNAGADEAAAITSRAQGRNILYAAAALAVLAVAVVLWSLMQPSRSTVVARHTTTLGAAGHLDGITFGVEAAISPDGDWLVFRSPLTGPGQLHVKRRDEAFARPIAGTEGGSGPFFSPDGEWIGFVAGGQLRRIPRAGGASLKLADGVDATYNRGAWLENGSIVYYDFPEHSLRLLGSGEAASRVIVAPSMLEGRYPWLPSPLPSSRGVLFTAHLTQCVGPVSCRPSKVYVYDARTDSVRVLFDDAIGAWHVPTGHVLYLTSGGTLMAAPWDNKKLEATGRAVPVLDGIQAPGFLVSNEGTAYYLLGRSEFAPGPLPNAELVWVNRAGQVERVDSSWQINTGGTDDGFIGTDWGISLSPDGRRIALSLLTELGSDIWIKQVPNGPLTRLTLHPGIDRSPVWTPDGRRVTFISDRPTTSSSLDPGSAFRVWEQSADGTGEPGLLWEHDEPTDAAASPDGRTLVFGARASDSTSLQRDILFARPGEDIAAGRAVATASDETGAAISPDSRWLAYASNEQGGSEVFVRPWPDVSGGKWQVSSGGGSAPLWSRSGRELFYVAHGKMNVVRVQPGASFSAEPPRVLFTIPDQVRAGSLVSGTFAITPDDQRFLMVRDHRWADMAGNPVLVVVQGLFDEVRAKAK